MMKVGLNMRYLKILIVFLFLVLAGTGSYYLYLRLAPPKSATGVDLDAQRPFKQVTSDYGDSVITQVADLTSADVVSSKTVKVQGKFQSGDPIQKVIDGVNYVYVCGVLMEDGSLTKIWLTEPEYETIKDFGTVFQNQLVIFTVSEGSVGFEKFLK
jgi:hypothetical protein